MRKVEFIRQLGALYEGSLDSARDAGVELRFGQTQDDRPEPSAWVAAEKEGLMAELTVWSSGEAEFVAGRPGQIEVNEHHDLESAEGLNELLNRLLAFVRR
jgi:hypothetical protein